MRKIPPWCSGLAIFLLLYAGLHYLQQTSWFRLVFDRNHPEVTAPPESELGKVIYILDYYRHANVQVVYDDSTYSAEWGWRQARAYLGQHALEETEDATQWIQKHSYLSSKGNIIYFQYPDGSQVPMRDVFLSQLAILNQSAPGGEKAGQENSKPVTN